VETKDKWLEPGQRSAASHEALVAHATEADRRLKVLTREVRALEARLGLGIVVNVPPGRVVARASI
jgi:hypothetical protein